MILILFTTKIYYDSRPQSSLMALPQKPFPPVTKISWYLVFDSSDS